MASQSPLLMTYAYKIPLYVKAGKPGIITPILRPSGSVDSTNFELKDACKKLHLFRIGPGILACHQSINNRDIYSMLGILNNR